MTDSNQPSDEQGAADDWEAALAQQAAAEDGAGETKNDAASTPGADNAWGEAMAEQHGGETGANGADQTKADNTVFKPLKNNGAASAPRELDMIMEIPVTLSVELGHTRLTIRELLDLAQGSVVELDGLAGEPMDILINGYLIAQGEVVVVDDKYGIRITEIVTPSERIHKLNR